MSLVYNYWCQNCVCGKEGKNIRNFTIDLTEEEAKEDLFCPNLPDEADMDTPLKQLGYKMPGGFLRFSGNLISKEEKQKFLWKRSHNDFKKNIEGRKNDLHNRFMGEVKGKA